jgi:hypothetical protein
MTLVEAARDAHTSPATAPKPPDALDLREAGNVLDMSLGLRNSFAHAHEHSHRSPRPFDVACVGAAHSNVDLVAFLEVQELDDLGRQPNGEIVAPLLDFHRPLLDSTPVDLGGALSSVNAVSQGA